GVVVLRDDEDVAVELRHLGRPGLGVGLLGLAHGRRHGLVPDGQVEVGDVDDLELGVRTLVGDGLYPVRDVETLPAGADASGHDGDLRHGSPWLGPEGREPTRYE